MDRVENCFFCERTSPEADLVAWFMGHERRMTHTECWFDAYRSKRLPGRAPGKTLEDIRRELETEFPTEPGTPEARLLVAAYVDGDADVEENHRAAPRRWPRSRHIRAGAVAAISGVLVIVGGYLWMSPETVRPAAIASAPEVSVSEVRTAAVITVASPTADEHREAAVAVPPALLRELDQQLKTLRSELLMLGTKLERSDSRISGIEAKVRGMEDAASAAALRATERTVPAPAQTARKPAPPVAVVAPAAMPMPAADSERGSPQLSAPERSPVADVGPVVEAVAPPAALAEPANPVPDVPPTLRDKLRADWRAVKEGFATAGQDFRVGMRDLARKISGD